jgi:hypothetical protein
VISFINIIYLFSHPIIKASLTVIKSEIARGENKTTELVTILPRLPRYQALLGNAC